MSLDVERILKELMGDRRHKFTYQGKEVPLNNLFSKTGALPILVRKAGLLCDFLFGEPLHVNYINNSKSLTGEEVVILDKQHPFTLVMLLYDTVEELIINAGDGDVAL